MRSLILLAACLCSPGGLPAAPPAPGPVRLTASLYVADHARRVFKTTADHYAGGSLAIPAHSLVYTTGPDAAGLRRIKKVWIGNNWTPGFISSRAADQPAEGTVAPTSDRFTFTARFTRLPACHVAPPR